MMFSERDEIRKVYFEAWRKFKAQESLSALEGQIIEVLLLHPQMHGFFERREEDFAGENPFLHLGLHLAVKDQVMLDRPVGVRDIFDALVRKVQDVHDVEHLMMESLAQILWDAQANGRAPDEKDYLEKLRLAFM